ncbi:DUF1236 domain-containing protein [Tropicimonas isoalkanivorans]|uniref:SH3 domain-containing protein n=1 Tax=Tropicimonas isoalkanivorans TaxID=441112 RepID=A0A1I1HLT5_9RHOB|nr:DUF1236 domain-containing protein [Tropicimonas isoalkanivorans]SFC24914.1 SH3 domain-containing protein [Tropicimonas isoalkanivorans]
MKRFIIGTTALSLLTAGAAAAQVAATATTDLNFRADPNGQAEIIDVIASGDSVDVLRCAEEASWCEVSHGGQTGWVYSEYLSSEHEGAPVIVAENPSVLSVETVVIEKDKLEPVLGLGTMGAIAGGIVGGPIGAVAGGVIGSGAGSTVDVKPEVVTYVRENPVEPIYLNGEVVVGATVPQEVVLTPVPDAEYEYLYVNGVPAVVDPSSRTIVTIVR